MTRGISVLAVMVLTVTQPAPYRPIPFAPVDQAKDEPELVVFRQRLIDVAERRAVDELLSLASQTTQTEGSTTVSSLRREFTEVVPPPWQAFKEALSLGGAFTTTRGAVRGRREFCAPYVYSAFPSTLPEWIGGEQLPWVIVRADAPVYARPSLSSPLVARTGHAIVEFLDHIGPGLVAKADPGWVHIALSPKRRGFVTEDSARSPEDWHVCMAREDGGWRVTEFARFRFELQ